MELLARRADTVAGVFGYQEVLERKFKAAGLNLLARHHEQEPGIAVDRFVSRHVRLSCVECLDSCSFRAGKGLCTASTPELSRPVAGRRTRAGVSQKQVAGATTRGRLERLLECSFDAFYDDFNLDRKYGLMLFVMCDEDAGYFWWIGNTCRYLRHGYHAAKVNKRPATQAAWSK